MNITLYQLKNLLDKQKELTIELLRSSSHYYNTESTEGHSKSLPIDKELFYELGMKARYPADIDIIEKYNID